MAAVCVRRRSSTKARIIPRFTLIAADERSTLLNIATPNSVKANGRYFMFWPRFTFKVPIWHLDNSSKVTGTNDTWALQSYATPLSFTNNCKPCSERHCEIFYHPITCLTVLIDYNNKFGGKDTILHLCHLLLALQALWVYFISILHLQWVCSNCAQN